MTYVYENKTDELRDKFLEKFGADERTFKEKLKAIGLAKATYSDFKYKRREPKKKTIESVVAYLENRQAKHDLVDPDVNFYCCTCETVLPNEVKRDKWTCKPCKNLETYKSRKNHWAMHLAKKRAYKLTKRYGKFASCMRTILTIKEELRKHEKENF